MALTLVTPPASEPVTLAEAKVHLRVDVADEDALITALIVAAREYVETFTHRGLITQTWDDKRDGFPADWNEPLWLAKPPVASVTSVTYVDMNGDTQTWSASLYITDLPSGPWARRGRVTPAWQQIYPVTRGQANAVTIRCVCGYGSSGSAVPSSLLAAMKLLIGHWYQSREAVVVGLRAAALEVPRAVDALLWPFKAF